jgi:hypothetical protein
MHSSWTRACNGSIHGWRPIEKVPGVLDGSSTRVQRREGFLQIQSGAGGEHPHSLADDDPDSEGLIDRSDRVVRAYEEWFAGYDQHPDELLERTFEETAGYDEMVLLRDIRFVLECEHRMAAIFGRAPNR